MFPGLSADGGVRVVGVICTTHPPWERVLGGLILQRWQNVHLGHLSRRRPLLCSDDRREFGVFAQTSGWLISRK